MKSPLHFRVLVWVKWEKYIKKLRLFPHELLFCLFLYRFVVYLLAALNKDHGGLKFQIRLLQGFTSIMNSAEAIDKYKLGICDMVMFNHVTNLKDPHKIKLVFFMLSLLFEISSIRQPAWLAGCPRTT